MEITLHVPNYAPERGIKYHWEDDSGITVRLEAGEVIIRANPAGLRTLANHLLNLAQEGMPVGSHMLFDSDNGLEDESVTLVLQKDED
ncbi:hypothetical protein I2I05_21445 [Hymenobacter sp. BT683]|uniref:Uncharacterized protein n=1 Tax=Hymenobacter jeongseonensis TaxID=2791027 RepID=A0ABS0INL4_9BACT|nr:hypothetical protein [Hymenobacter jeongseonensis]MBF9239971.1 hypothetical protein [Hymenobacter jeongseonensis]